MINSSHNPVMFRLQEGKRDEWRVVVNTSLPSPLDIAEPGRELRLENLAYLVGERSVVVLSRAQRLSS